MNAPSPTILTICATCGMKKDTTTGIKPTNPAAEALARETATLLASEPVEVRLTSCMSICDKPIAWALRNEDRHATIFSPATTPEDLATTARLYLATPLGEKMPKRQLPPNVIPTLISRIPPIK